MGLDCVKVAEDQKATKAKMVVVGGFLSVFGGILMCKLINKTIMIGMLIVERGEKRKFEKLYLIWLV